MLMIPHVGGTPTGRAVASVRPPVTQDEAWPVFLAEREELICVLGRLGKPVLVLTGDLHNSFSIKITERVWEFASGPHNSRNHRAEPQGIRPPNGAFDSLGRRSDIRWSSYFLPDVPAPLVAAADLHGRPDEQRVQQSLEPGKARWVAYPHPQVVVQFFDGFTRRPALRGVDSGPPMTPILLFIPILATSLAYAILRYHVFAGVAWVEFPLHVSNKGISRADAVRSVAA